MNLPSTATSREAIDPSAAAYQAIAAGSSSFASAARLFDATTRESTVLLYAWCRHCDDVIDGQASGHGQRDGDRSGGLARLAQLEDATRQACRGQPNGTPVFNGLARVVARHDLPEHLLFEHLQGFRMDVQGCHYAHFCDTLLYCYRVAGVVGLLMSRVMGADQPAVLDRACDLGIAFQLTNIARDIVEDGQIGRIYVPADWLAQVGVPQDEVHDPRHRRALAAVAARLIESAEPYYRSAGHGLSGLGFRSAWSVATARDVYREIGIKVRKRGERAWDSRVSTSTSEKLWFAARGVGVALLSRAATSRPRDPQLWQRPTESEPALTRQ